MDIEKDLCFILRGVGYRKIMIRKAINNSTAVQNTVWR